MYPKLPPCWVTDQSGTKFYCLLSEMADYFMVCQSLANSLYFTYNYWHFTKKWAPSRIVVDVKIALV